MKVYWTPMFADERTDWNMLYYDLQSLFDHCRPLMTLPKKDPKIRNFFFCPAFTQLAKNTFVLVNPIESHYVFENNNPIPKSPNFINVSMDHEPSMKDRLLIIYNMSYLFFSEGDLNAKLVGPYFSQTTHTQYGVLCPGKFNIGKWFRPMNCEYQLHENVNEFVMKKDEHMGYVEFETDEPIELIRFTLTEKIQKLSTACSTSASWEKLIPLSDRYKRFIRSRTNKVLLDEIKKNIVSDK